MGVRRIVVAGKNCLLSATPSQDAAKDAERRAKAVLADAGQELFLGYHHCHHASTLFIRAHALRNEPAMRDHYHRMAMDELDQLAEALGLDLVPRGEAVTR